MTLVDARGVEISPGDTAIYGFSLGRIVAMAEAVVLGEQMSSLSPAKVSLTPSGRVRLRVVRRSYGGGQKPIVDVAPDRLVVLKPITCGMHAPGLFQLPPSPLPTQTEKNRHLIENLIESYKADLRATEVPDWYYYKGMSLGEFHVHVARRLKELRKELRELDNEE